MPDSLGKVLGTGDDQMVVEYRVGVDLYVVEAALTTLETQVELLRRAVVLAKETWPCRQRRLVGLCRAGNDTAGIELYLRIQTTYLKTADAHGLEGAEIGCGQRPHGELVFYEFAELVHLE